MARKRRRRDAPRKPQAEPGPPAVMECADEDDPVALERVIDILAGILKSASR
jgi:hypothetical protein